MVFEKKIDPPEPEEQEITVGIWPGWNPLHAVCMLLICFEVQHIGTQKQKKSKKM